MNCNLDSSGGMVYPCKFKSDYRSSDRKNYFWHAIQNVRQALSALPDILSPCQTLFPVNDWQISMVIVVFLVAHLCVLNPAGQNVRLGLSSLPDITRSLPDMSGIISCLAYFATTAEVDHTWSLHLAWQCSNISV